MIKSEIIEVMGVENTHPKLMKSTLNDLIILVEKKIGDHYVGVVVYEKYTAWDVGVYSKAWVAQYFEGFGGSVTLSNVIEE